MKINVKLHTCMLLKYADGMLSTTFGVIEASQQHRFRYNNPIT